jgi:hypothetical protein
MFWLARKFNRPVYAWYARTTASPHPLDLLWFDERGNDPTKEKLPLDKYFRYVEVVTMRSAWNDRNAIFVGFKAGDNKFNHSHLDIGTFVLDALGYLWSSTRRRSPTKTHQQWQKLFALSRRLTKVSLSLI